MYICVIPIVICVLFVLVLLFINVYYEGYWKKRGVKFYSKNRIFGLSWDIVTQPNRTKFEIISDLYNAYKGEPAIAIGLLTTPALLVLDPINTQHVLENDFKSFYHRGFQTNEQNYLAYKNIAFMNGVRWKLARRRFTSLFTTSKLKDMYHSIDDTAREFVEYLKDKTNPEESTYKTVKRFSSAAIIAAVFGIKHNPTFDTPFHEQVNVGVPATFTNHMKFMISLYSPLLTRILRIYFFGDIQIFFKKFLQTILTIMPRDPKSSARHFMELNKSGKMKINKGENLEINQELSDELIAANTFFFISGSSEAGTPAIFSILLLLAQYPNVQEQLFTEISNIGNTCMSKLTYTLINKMTYLDKVVNEAFRMYPAVPFLTRKCTKDTTLPVGNIKVDKGSLILIPIYQHHNDPDYFPNPEVFDPERFSDSSLVKFSIYKPFGRGPRTCLAMRYSKLQVKILVVHILRNFKLEMIPGQEEVKFANSLLTMDFDMSLKFTSRL